MLFKAKTYKASNKFQQTPKLFRVKDRNPASKKFQLQEVFQFPPTRPLTSNQTLTTRYSQGKQSLQRSQLKGQKLGKIKKIMRSRQCFSNISKEDCSIIQQDLPNLIRKYEIFFLLTIYSQKKFEINSQKDKNFHLLKIFDWQMEVCQNLYLSKDTFYTAATMAKRFYSKQRNQYYCQKILEIQVAAMISIAAKLESNKVNYPEAISVVCNFNKGDIVDGQIFIMKSLNFNVPRVNILLGLVEACNNWTTYLLNSKIQPKLNLKNVGFGESKNIKTWDQNGKVNFMELSSIFDIFAINLQSKYDFEDQSRIKGAILQSLFLFVNYKQKQLFPMSPSQKTIVCTVFQDFMRSKYQYKKQEFTVWLVDVIRQQKNRNFVEKIYQYFQNRIASRKYPPINKQDYFSDQSTQSNCSLFGQFDFCQQRYLKI